MRLIDAGSLIAEMHDTILEDGEDRRIFYEVIERQHTIDPVKHGKWEFEPGMMYCSSCGWLYEYYAGLEEEYNYCPNCGADMRGE